MAYYSVTGVMTFEFYATISADNEEEAKEKIDEMAVDGTLELFMNEECEHYDIEKIEVASNSLPYVDRVPLKLPDGMVLVHNPVYPADPIGMYGFRIWVCKEEELTENQVVCTCPWAPHIEKHYRTGRDLGNWGEEPHLTRINNRLNGIENEEERSMIEKLRASIK